MTPERHQRLKELFDAAIDLPPEDRAAYMDQHCADDLELRAEVKELILQLERPTDPRLKELEPRPRRSVLGRSLPEESVTLTGLKPVEFEYLSRRFDLLDAGRGGGMGMVFRARHRDLERIMAIKICHGNATGDRFRREARLLARVKSAHIVSVHDFDRLPTGRGVLIMDWIDGHDLSQMIGKQSGPLPESRALPWMKQVSDGMWAAAKRAIVHRDLKPSNILIDRQDCALIVDFGLASSWDQPDLTRAGTILGTPHYMAPEQIEDPQSADTRADVYSFGAMFYHVLAGRPPFEATSLLEVMLKHKTEPPVSLQALNPEVSANTGECIERCLAKSPRDRFQTFKAVSESLGQGRGAEDSPWNVSDDPKIASFMSHYWTRRSHILADLTGDEVFGFPHGRRLIIRSGRVEKEVADAIVSSDDSRISMEGGVSASILRAGGSITREHAAAYSHVRAGRVAVTSAGRLSARFIFHGITMGYEDAEAQDWVRPSRDIINEVLESCFYHADTLTIRTIALPLLGTGTGRFPRDVCLDTMVRFLASKLTRGVTTVREARIIVYPSPGGGRPK